MESRLRKALWAALPVIGASLCTHAAADAPDLRQSPSDLASHPSQPAESSLERRNSAPPEGARAGERSAGDVRASQVIGMDVEDRAGRRVGRIEDVMIDMHEGRAAYALLDAGPNAEIGGQRVALPIDRISGAPGRDRIVLDVDPAQLRTYPTIRQGRDPDWDQIHERLGEGDRPSSGPMDNLQRFRGAGELLQADLRDRAGDDVGDVKDFVLNLRTGEIRYGVAELDASLMARGQLVVVPVRSVESEVGGTDLVIHVDRAELRDAPAFDRDRWPDVNEPGFRARLDAFIAKIERDPDRRSDNAGG